MKTRFSASHHLPKYSRMLYDSLFSPAIIFFVVMGNTFLFICILGLYYFERAPNPNIESLFDVIWWGVTTVTTVGYGDIVPITTGGRVVSMILMISGVSFFVGFSAILFSTFMAIENKHMLLEESKHEEMLNLQVLKRLEALSAQIQQLESRMIDRD